MLGTLFVFGVPLFAAFIQLRGRLDKGFAFFCSSLLSFFITISMISCTIPWLKSILGSCSDFLYLCIFPGVGFLLTFVIYLLLSLLIKGSRAQFPEKAFRWLQFLSVYTGTLLQVVLLILGSSLFLVKIMPETSVNLLNATGKILPRTMSVCGRTLTEQQIKWLRYAPLQKPAAAEKPSEKEKTEAKPH